MFNMCGMFTVVLATNRTAAFAAYDAAVSAKKAEGFPKTMWWAIITLTTVGYGDVVPATAMGKVVASVVALTGLLHGIALDLMAELFRLW